MVASTLVNAAVWKPNVSSCCHLKFHQNNNNNLKMRDRFAQLVKQVYITVKEFLPSLDDFSLKSYLYFQILLVWNGLVPLDFFFFFFKAVSYPNLINV